MIKTYSELMAFETLEERYRYLALSGVVAQSTFGFDRYINQRFYKSKQWAQIRHAIILRDNGCDLGVEGFEVHNRLIIHHMNPMEPIDITSGGSNILDPEYLITTTHMTHNAIHYGDERLLPREFVARSSGDTHLWKRKEIA